MGSSLSQLAAFRKASGGIVLFQSAPTLLRSDISLQWKAHLRIEVVDNNSIVVVDGQECDLLTGHLLATLAPFLERPRSVSSIIDALSNELTPPEVTYALEFLYKRGLIVEGTDATPGIAAFWHLQNTTPEAAKQALGSTRVRLLGTLGPARTALSDALLDSGIALSTDGDTEAFTILLVDDYLDSSLSVQNGCALESGARWMMLCLDGREALIGPHFHPGETACWACLEQRLKSNRQIERFFDRSGITRPAGFASEMPKTDARDVSSVLKHVLDKVDRAGLEVLVLDQTQPEIELSVVKVMVPGLRHFWKRFGPGRLFDVPVAQGWQVEKLTEDRLNPYGIFF